MKKLALIVLMIACFAVPAASATAQTNGYTKVAGTTEGGGNGGTPESQVASTVDTGGDSLPFTGLELGLMLSAGVLLLGTGLVLRRVRTQ